MWAIKNKKYGNYYHSTINKNLRHFVRDIEDAKKMTKWSAKKLIAGMNNPDNYELQEVKKWK